MLILCLNYFINYYYCDDTKELIKRFAPVANLIRNPVPTYLDVLIQTIWH